MFAQCGLQFLAVLTVLAGRVVRIDSHAVHVSLPFDLSFAKDTYLPHPRYSRPEGVQSRKTKYVNGSWSFTIFDGVKYAIAR